LEIQDWVSISADSTTISANGSNLTAAIPTSLGTKSFTLVVNSRDFAGLVPQVFFSFDLVVTCIVTGIAFDSPKISDALDYLIDQPKIHSFSLVWTPACLNQGVFSVSPNLSFVGLTTTSNTSFNIVVQNALL
jgi:hypothetical protein